MTETAPEGAVQVHPHFPILDTLRAVGSLAVLTTHTSFQTGTYTQHGTWGTLLGRLDVGVAIFFVLSGFLLSRPYFARATIGASRPRTSRYYVKRLVRIYPVYLVTAVIALAAIPDNDALGVVDWLVTLSLTDVYLRDALPHGLTQMWSLAAEIAFYLLLPLLMLAGIGRRRPPVAWRTGLLLGGMVVISFVWHLLLTDRLARTADVAASTWLPAYLSWFAVGIAFAAVHVAGQAAAGTSARRSFLTNLGRSPGACWTIAAGLLLITATPLAGPTLLVPPTASESLTKHVMYACIGGLLVLTGINSDPSGLYARLMSTRPLRHLGHISYSLFCIHLPILYAVWHFTGYEMFRGHGWEVWALTLLLSLVASELLFRFVESPGMRLGRRPGPTPQTAAKPATPAAAKTTR